MGLCRLFNGKEFNREGVSVGDGQLEGGGRSAHQQVGPVVICSVNTAIAPTFHFRVEAMINDGGNSGQYFRAQFGPRFPSGYEAQINGARRDRSRPAASTRLSTGSWRPRRKRESSSASRCTGRTVVYPGSHRHRRSHRHPSERSDSRRRGLEPTPFTKGHFALQQHGPETMVKFRKIEVKELP